MEGGVIRHLPNFTQTTSTRMDPQEDVRRARHKTREAVSAVQNDMLG
jgi:hypothetical protein